MANSPTHSDPIDRLSNLHDDLLVTIISFLPTRIAARTSVLCHRFRHLWEASPSVELIRNDYPCHLSGTQNFVAMANRALLSRNPSPPLLSLRMGIPGGHRNAIAIVSSLLAKARSLDLRHLTMEVSYLSDLLLILPNVFTINSLTCLSLDSTAPSYRHSYWQEELDFPCGINLSSLRSLSLKLLRTDLANFNELLSELCSLEILRLHITGSLEFRLSSQTIRKLKLIITEGTLKVFIVELSLPLLESLHLDIRCCLGTGIHAKVPLLRKAVIKLGYICEDNVSTVDGLLNCISHVEELSLDLDESTEGHPIPILLEAGKDVPKFSNLKHLDVTLCFHEHNLAAVIMMLHNCPILKSLKLAHKVPVVTGLATERKRKHWASKLPCNSDGNNYYAYYRNLHLEEDCKEFMKLLITHARN